MKSNVTKYKHDTAYTEFITLINIQTVQVKSLDTPDTSIFIYIS